MELIPFLIFAVIAFNLFKGFTKAAAKTGGATAKEMMRQLHAQNNTPNISRYREKSPTQRGRESLARQDQSPWNPEHDLSVRKRALTPGEQVAVNHLKKTKLSRKASHKSPIQRGRRGKNMDQNRHRTDEWGSRGDSGILSGRNAVILLVVGGLVLFGLSQISA